GTGDWLGEDVINRPAIDLLGNQSDTNEDRDEQAEYGNGPEAQVDQDDLLDTHRDASQKDRRTNHQEGEDNQVVEDTFAHGFLEGPQRDGYDSCHKSPP